MMVSNSQALAPYQEMGNTFAVVAKSTAGVDLPKLPKGAKIHVFNEHPKLDVRFNRGFLLRAFQHIQIMVGWTGALRCAAFLWGGKVNPVQFTTLSLTSESGDLKNYPKEAIMPEQISLNEVASSLCVENDRAVVSSKIIADQFGKSHKNVLRDIEALDCSESFRKLNFEPSFYEAKSGNGTTRRFKCYSITRDGFAFLAMGFTGKKAAQFKEAYIQAFNQMEQKLHSTPALPEPQDRQAVIRERIEAMLDFDTSYLRILISVEKGKVTMKRILSQDELVMNRARFINYFKAPDSGFTDLNQLIELSAAVNERICRVVQSKEGKQC